MLHFLSHEGGLDSAVDAVCELFSHDQAPEVFEHLRATAESPLQVPFHFLGLIRSQQVRLGATRPCKPSVEQVELAYRAILQRAPESQAAVLEHVHVCENIEQLITGLLASREAILRMPLLFARAFPMVRRLWHVHIPKTAGSSFCAAADDNGWGSVNTNILSGAEGELQRVAAAVRLSPHATGWAIVTGHWRLTQHLDDIGPFDRVVVFVRDPVECFISEFNYAVDVIHRSPNVHAADPQLMMDRGLDPESFVRSYERGFFIFNVQCGYLADDGTCATALAHLASCQAELLPCEAASRAIFRYFPGIAHRRVNASNKHVRSEDICPSLREEISVRSGQDYLLNHVAQIRYRASTWAPLATVRGRDTSTAA